MAKTSVISSPGQEASGVEIVTGQIQEDATAGAQKLDRTQAVAAHAAEHLDVADRSRRDQLPGAGVAAVVPPLKPDLKRDTGPSGRHSRPLPPGRPNRPAVSPRRSACLRRRRGDVLVVNDRRRRNDDRFDVRPGQERLDALFERTGRRS